MNNITSLLHSLSRTKSCYRASVSFARSYVFPHVRGILAIIICLIYETICLPHRFSLRVTYELNPHYEVLYIFAIFFLPVFMQLLSTTSIFSDSLQSIFVGHYDISLRDHGRYEFNPHYEVLFDIITTNPRRSLWPSG